MTDTVEALGLPLTGEKPYFNRNTTAEQRPIEELRPMIEQVFAHEDVDSFRWVQYTPYFNDGDVCEFSVTAGDYQGFVKLTSLAEEENEETGEPYFDADDTRIKGGHTEKFMYVRDLPPDHDPERFTPRVYSSRPADYGYYRTTDEPAPEHSAYHDIKKLQDAINSGAFYDALYRTFGDHVTVTVHRDRIELETYEHD